MIHHHLYRARLALLAAALSAVALVAVEFPFSLLIHQRSALARTSGELADLNARNAGLQGDIRALSSKATIAEIAHEDYGLVGPGQLSFVILPAAGSAAATSLEGSSIPPRDLVASTAPPTASPQPSTVHGPGLWRRFVSRLEFWN
ncbi:MAG TPA: septum formation initiator family protein [Acidimicrobiales bacterium]|nr:septum formation initiator family protein [Acidimicrobiales bacterium]